MEAVSHGALPDSRAALQAEPARLQEELQSLQTQIQTLVLDNFKAHVSSFRCEADVRKEVSMSCVALGSRSESSIEQL
jgi:hypothetical protein